MSSSLKILMHLNIFSNLPFPAFATEGKWKQKRASQKNAVPSTSQGKLLFMVLPTLTCDRKQKDCNDFAARREQSASLRVEANPYKLTVSNPASTS